MKDLLDIDQYCHLCVEKSHSEEFLNALFEIKDFGVELVERSDIESADFSIDISVYSKSLGSQCKELLENCHPTIELSHPKGEEILDNSGSPKSHAYTYHLKTHASGPFEHIMNFYLSLNKSNLNDFVDYSDIQLKTETAMAA